MLIEKLQIGLAVCPKINLHFQTHSVPHVWGLIISCQKHQHSLNILGKAYECFKRETESYVTLSCNFSEWCLFFVWLLNDMSYFTVISVYILLNAALLPLFPLPLYLSNTSSYAWANSFSCEWFVGSRPGMKPAMVALHAGWWVERGRPADYRSDPVCCCASSLQLLILLLFGVQSNTSLSETSDALAHTKSPAAHFQAGLDNP